MFDGRAFGIELVDMVKAYVDRMLAPIAAKLAMLEARQPEKGAPGERGEPGIQGPVGAGIAEALIDQDGMLVLTMSDGTARQIGRVVGRDGRNVDMHQVKAMIEERIAELPPPKDGRDGFGFEDMNEELADDGRTIVRRYRRGDDIKEFRLTTAVLLDRGVWRDGGAYRKGDGVTWAGSFWIAQEDTTDKPETSDAWRLAVKRGRDGRSAR